jgi:hypothetical protein
VIEPTRPARDGDPAGWYQAPSGAVLRWWTGQAWGHDVADLAARPDPPPAWRRELPADDVTTALELPRTAPLQLPPRQGRARPDAGRRPAP